MSDKPKPSPQNRDDNLDDLGRDVRTGKARDEQHPQQSLEIGEQVPPADTK
jgi:hypothetical protein